MGLPRMLLCTYNMVTVRYGYAISVQAKVIISSALQLYLFPVILVGSQF